MGEFPRHTGEGRYPPQTWVPACAGMARNEDGSGSEAPAYEAPATGNDVQRRLRHSLGEHRRGQVDEAGGAVSSRH